MTWQVKIKSKKVWSASSCLIALTDSAVLGSALLPGEPEYNSDAAQHLPRPPSHSHLDAMQLRGEIGALRMTGKPGLSVKWREARDLDGLFTGPFSVPGSLPSSRYLPSYLKTQKNEIVQTSLSEDYNKVIGIFLDF